MLQVRRRLDLGQEPLGSHDCCDFGLQDLQRNLALVLDIGGQVDRGHPALAYLTLDRVAAVEGCVQSVDEIGHRGVVGRQGTPSLDQIDQNRSLDAFERTLSELSQSVCGPTSHLTVHVLTHHHLTRARHALDAGRDVHAIAVDIAVLRHDDLAHVHADPERAPLLLDDLGS